MKTTLLFLALAFNFILNAQVDTKMYGQKILDGKIKPSDDKKTFQLMDSLFCKNKADKDFYFSVFNKILQKSDGALSEQASVLASEYYFNYNMEFIERSNSMTSVVIYKWLELVAFDLYASNQNHEKGLPAIKVKIYSLVQKFSNDSPGKAKSKTYSDYLYKKTSELVKAG